MKNWKPHSHKTPLQPGTGFQCIVDIKKPPVVLFILLLIDKPEGILPRMLSIKNKIHETFTNRNLETSFLVIKTMSPKLTGAGVEVDHIFPALAGRHNWPHALASGRSLQVVWGLCNSETHTDLSLQVHELGDRILVFCSSISSGKKWEAQIKLLMLPITITSKSWTYIFIYL